MALVAAKSMRTIIAPAGPTVILAGCVEPMPDKFNRWKNELYAKREKDHESGVIKTHLALERNPTGMNRG